MEKNMENEMEVVASKKPTYMPPRKVGFDARGL